MRVMLVGLLVTLAACSNSPPAAQVVPTGPTSTAAPSAISRATLMSRYAELAPLDRSATPASIDTLAYRICSLLRQGKTTDELITTVTDTYRSNATEVVRLIVSYKCTEYLKSFK